MATISDLAAAMFGVEGTDPNAINHRNNNPGNLVYAGQSGAVLGEGGFAKFSSWEAGTAAAIKQIGLDLTRGTDVTGRPTTTLAELISSWSPSNASGNSAASTNSYISTVASRTGLDPNADLANQLGFQTGKIHKG